MKKCFVISWYYPPGNSSEGLVTFKLLKNSNYQYDVWTRKDQQQSMWDRRSDESKLTSKNIQIIKCDCDGMKDWVKQGIKYFEKHRDEYDMVMSRSMPVESHELAIKIKEKFPEIKWIASFGDPIINTPYIDEITMENQKNPFSLTEYFGRERVSMLRMPRLVISPVRQAKKYLWKKDKRNGSKIARFFEKINTTVLKEADVLIYNNPYQFEHAFTRKAYRRYKKKARILEHSYDEELYPNKKKVGSSKIKSFIYVGHLDDTRNASALFKAIKKLKSRDPRLKNRVNFTFYGHLCDRDKIYILENDLADVIKLKNDIKYVESLEVIQNADWAILIDANFTNIVDDCIYLPAKLIDYIGAKTRVFSISHVKGAGGDIIREIGGGKVVTHSPDDIYLYLSKIIYQNYEPVHYDKKKAERFSSKIMAKRLDKIIEELK